MRLIGVCDSVHDVLDDGFTVWYCRRTFDFGVEQTIDCYVRRL